MDGSISTSPQVSPPEVAPLHGAEQHMVQLDALRALAVLGVMAHHYLPAAPWGLPSGAEGVRLFFVLSGFLITGILLRGRQLVDSRGQSRLFTARQFYCRRFLRIFPVFYFVLLVAALLNIEEVRRSLPWHLGYLSNVYAVIVRKDGWPGAVGHLWSLSVEEQFYLLWPWVILLVPRRHLLAAIVATIGLGALFRFPLWLMLAQRIIAHDQWGGLLPASLDALGAGALLALVSDPHFGGAEPARRLCHWALRIALPALIIFCAGAWVPHTWSIRFLLFDVAVTCLSVWLVGSAMQGIGGPAGALLRWKPLVYLGTISYGVYLYHMFLRSLLRQSIGTPAFEALGAPLRCLILIGPAILVPMLSWHLLERPLNNLKRFFPYERRAPAAAEATA